MDYFLIPKATVINLFIGSSRDTVSLRARSSTRGKQLHKLLGERKPPGSGAGGDGGGTGAHRGGAEQEPGAGGIPWGWKWVDRQELAFGQTLP